MHNETAKKGVVIVHITKFKSNQLGQIITHIERPADRDYSNENINPAKSKENYRLIDRGNTVDYINNRVNEVKHINRSDVVKVVGVCVTLPKDYKGNEKDFFRETARAFSERYGANNIAYATVHKDEVSPHLHIGVIPIVKDKDGQERLCCKDLFNKQELQRLHPEIEKSVNKRLKEPVRLQNGNTERDKEGRAYRNVKELKREKTREQREQQRETPRGLFGIDYKKAYEQEKEKNEQLDRENRQLKYKIDKTTKSLEYTKRELREYAQEYSKLSEQFQNPERLRERARELEHKRQTEHERNERINEYEREQRENHQR